MADKALANISEIGIENQTPSNPNTRGSNNKHGIRNIT